MLGRERAGISDARLQGQTDLSCGALGRPVGHQSVGERDQGAKGDEEEENGYLGMVSGEREAQTWWIDSSKSVV